MSINDLSAFVNTAPSELIYPPFVQNSIDDFGSDFGSVYNCRELYRRTECGPSRYRRMSVGSCLFGRVVLACLLSAPAAWAQQPSATSNSKTSASVPKIPYPSGPFGVGRVGYDWVDTTRLDNYDPKRKRELMVYFWYPTAKSAGAKGQYLPGAAQIDAAPAAHEMMSQEFGKSWALIVSGKISSHAIDGALIARSRTPFPVVTFSHGLGGTGFGYTVLIENLVSHGYVVASIEHTYTAKAVWFPDLRVITERNLSPPAGLSQAERLSWMMKQTSVGIDQGAADVRFVIDRMSQFNHEKQHFALAGAIDLERLTAMGHSAGAEFAARACQQDSRIYACVDLDGAMVPIAALPLYGDDRKILQPLLFLEAFHPENNMGGPPDQIAEYKKVKEKQLQELRPGSYDVVLRSPGIAHPSFSDVPLLFHGQDGYPEPPIALHNLDLIARFVRAFLDKTVLGEKQALFDGNTSPVPEATVTAYGH